MQPYVADPDFLLLNCDVLDGLASLPDESVHCVVTSPPYLGLRDYGDPGQIGLEPTIGAYVARLVEVFAEVRRVLRRDGTVWLNLGDSYNAYNGGAGPSSALSQTQSAARPRLATGFGLQQKELKPKDLMGVPWRVAFALQADGWYLRSDIVWSKPNPMPESVTDRPTKAHEYVFLLSRSARYFYDAAAIAEPASWYGPNGHPKAGPHAEQMQTRAGARRPQMRRAAELAEQHGLTDAHLEAIRAVGISDTGKALTTTLGAGKSDPEKQRLADEAKEVLGGYYREFLTPPTRNARSVWEIQTQQYAEAHFATFPEELARRCILAGCPDDGTVLDPFLGSGTTAYVARRLGRRSVGIELNADYCELAARRMQQQSLLAGASA